MTLIELYRRIDMLLILEGTKYSTPITTSIGCEPVPLKVDSGSYIVSMKNIIFCESCNEVHIELEFIRKGEYDC